MRIVFMGTPDFAVASLRVLHGRGYDVAAVVTAPDKPRGRGQQITHTPVKTFALEHHLPVLQPESLKDPAFITALQQFAADLIVVVAFRILPREVFTIPHLGSFNLHASLLPQYRGAAPINWAVMNGEQETGVTTFFLQEKVDTGSMILQARVKIGSDETAGELHDKLAEVGGEIVFQTARLIETGKAQPRSQNDALASPAPKIFKDDCRIRWDRTSAQVHDHVRGLSPYPCAWTTFQEKIIRIYRTRRTEHVLPANVLPATIIAADNSVMSVATNDGVVEILELQQEGKKRLLTGEFLRGFRAMAGERFA